MEAVLREKKNLREDLIRHNHTSVVHGYTLYQRDYNIGVMKNGINFLECFNILHNAMGVLGVDWDLDVDTSKIVCRAFARKIMGNKISIMRVVRKVSYHSAYSVYFSDSLSSSFQDLGLMDIYLNSNSNEVLFPSSSGSKRLTITELLTE